MARLSVPCYVIQHVTNGLNVRRCGVRMGAVRCSIHGHQIRGPMTCRHLSADIWGGVTTRRFREYRGDFFDVGTMVLEVAICIDWVARFSFPARGVAKAWQPFQGQRRPSGSRVARHHLGRSGRYCSSTDITPHYQYAYFDDGRHVEIKRPLWTVTTPVNEASSYRVVQHARNNALL